MLESSVVEISVGEFCDLLQETKITNTLDLGGAILHEGTHSVQGRIVLLNEASGRCCLIKL